MSQEIHIQGAKEHNLKDLSLKIPRDKITVVTGVSGSGKSSLVFDTVLAEAQRRFFFTLSNYSRQYLEMSTKPDVLSIRGLSPAISVAQNETAPSKLATVGTQSDIAELLGVLFARFGDKYCPKHDLLTTALTTEEIAKSIFDQAGSKLLMFVIPFVTLKKGHFTSQLDRFYKLGFLKAIIDDKVQNLSAVLDLDKSKKHTIKIIVDVLSTKDPHSKRFIDAIQTTLNHGEGVGEVYTVRADKSIDQLLLNFSSQAGCPKCGYSWSQIDSRYFSANSLGRCQECSGLGVLNEIVKDEVESESDDDEVKPQVICTNCQGTGVLKDRHAIRILGYTIHQLLLLELDSLYTLFKTIFFKWAESSPPKQTVVEQIVLRLEQICGIGLGYTSLSRRIKTLSTGEFQRLRLANVFGQNLRGVLYVLDEPSQGLHPSEVEAVWRCLQELKTKGNTILVIDHDSLMMKKADLLIDMGPGGGAQGGQIMAMFPPSQASSFTKLSLTAKHLENQNKSPKWAASESSKQKDQFITMKDPSLHNLRMPNVRFKLGALNVITGVSGAGKSSLVIDTLYLNLYQWVHKQKKSKKYEWLYCKNIEGHQNLKFVHMLTRSPIARSSVSMPATYLDALKDIREIYAKLPDAQISGLSAKSFSIHSSGGRCETCKGRGEVLLTMRFLPDVRVLCEECEGKRFIDPVLAIQFNGHSLSDLFNLTIEEVAEVFKNFSLIQKKLKPAIQLGLGYLKFGQPTVSLSGGESQRLKLSPFLVKKHGAETLIIIEEPTTGLHFSDVNCLEEVLREIVAKGSTVLLIEHNDRIIRAADWLVDIGPGAAKNGGQLLYEGAPSGLLKVKGSLTSRYL